MYLFFSLLRTYLLVFYFILSSLKVFSCKSFEYSWGAARFACHGPMTACNHLTVPLLARAQPLETSPQIKCKLSVMPEICFEYVQEMLSFEPTLGLVETTRRQDPFISYYKNNTYVSKHRKEKMFCVFLDFTFLGCFLSCLFNSSPPSTSSSDLWLLPSPLRTGSQKAGRLLPHAGGRTGEWSVAPPGAQSQDLLCVKQKC